MNRQLDSSLPGWPLEDGKLGLFKDSISFFPMDAPQGSADLAILPEDVASLLSCGNLALWRDKDYVLTCSDRDIDTDLFCPGDLTSPTSSRFPTPR